MDSIDLVAAERRARLRYEWTRARRALIGFAPVLLVVLGASALTPRPAWVWFFGLGLFAVGVVLLWYGRDLRRAVLPGVAAGLVPLVLALCANHLGHVCMGDECMTWCVPACTAGGIISGLAVASVGLGRRSGAGFWLSASAISLLTGAMGCACVGYSGVVGLGLGFAAGTVPGLVRRFLTPTTS